MSEPVRATGTALHEQLTEMVEQLCEDGKIPGAWKDGSGEWWIPDAAARDMGGRAAEAVRQGSESASTAYYRWTNRQRTTP